MTDQKIVDKKLLKLDICSYWHAGAGRGSGSHLDALVERDVDELPFVSGKMLKGLLRDAVNRAAQWQVLPVMQGLAEHPEHALVVGTLFGTPGFGEGNIPRDDTKPGVMKVSDARMPEILRDWLRGDTDEHRLWRSGLYRSVYSTAIETGSGVAKRGSLRGQEVTVPMLLQAQISLLPAAVQSTDKQQRFVIEHWHEIIQQSLPLIRAIGSNRTRGLGKACLTLQDVEAVA